MDLGWYHDLNEWFPDRDHNYVPIWEGRSSSSSAIPVSIRRSMRNGFFECSCCLANIDGAWLVPAPIAAASDGSALLGRRFKPPPRGWSRTHPRADI